MSRKLGGHASSRCTPTEKRCTRDRRSQKPRLVDVMQAKPVQWSLVGSLYLLSESAFQRDPQYQAARKTRRPL